MKKINFLLIALFCSASLLAQGIEANRKFSLQFDVGTDISFGKNQLDWKTGTKNSNYVISYYSFKSYNNPSVRGRVSLLYPVMPKTKMGLQSGISYRFGETFGSERYHVVCMPIQARIIQELLRCSKTTWAVDAAAGINIFKVSTVVHVENTGSLFSFGFFADKNRYYLRAGVEYQIDRGYGIIFEDPLNGYVAENVRYTTDRVMAYFGISVPFRIK